MDGVLRRFAILLFTLSAAGGLAAGELTKWVCPFAGTVGDGNTFPGPCRPFGMVQPGPDTSNEYNPSGYKRSDSAIRGFSTTHLNGTGCAALGDLALQPFTGEIDGGDYSSAWNRQTERAEPGYYAVTLERFGTRVEITATERVAIYRFSWPKGKNRRLFVDGARFLRNPWNDRGDRRLPWHRGEAAADRREITGGRGFADWVSGEVHYAVRFDCAADRIDRTGPDGFRGDGDRWVCDFGTDDAPVEVRVAVSSVSADAARDNLSEADGKSFDEVRGEADAEWESYLSRMTIEGSDELKRNFYTALYHLFVQPNNLADRDGRYRGADGKVAEAADGVHYTTLSLWDTFRTAHPLYTLVADERVNGFLDSLMAFGRAHGHLPMWSLWGRESHCMIGQHAIPVLADAWAKGFRNLDPKEALQLMVKSMTRSGGCCAKMDWKTYKKYGYIPTNAGSDDGRVVEGESVSRTLEQAFDWWCIAHFARQIGDAKVAERAEREASAWRNVIDPETHLARGRAFDGSWRTPFNPYCYTFEGKHWGDYTEANAWIYTWHVFQDADALAEILGGRDRAIAQLDRFFAAKDDSGLRHGRLGQYWHGNEPSHHIAYLYTVWGQPEKTEELVRKLCLQAYSSADDGLCGNDDCGQMSAWYLSSMLGFYPLNPCDGGYMLAAPQVRAGTLRLPGGRRLKITTRNFGEGRVARVLLDGRELPSRWISHPSLIKARELCFVFEKPSASALKPSGKSVDPSGKVDLSGYRIVWRDEFNGSDIDTTKWESPTQERQGSSLWNPRNVSVKDGAAVFKIRKTDDPTFRYESACLRTTRGYDPNNRLYTFARGYIEARCKLPKHLRSDYWFALWMMVGEVSERNQDTRKGCEVDIMETFHLNDNGRMPHTFHWGGYGRHHNSHGFTVRNNPELLDGGWHTFGCLWTENTMSFTIDGRITWTTDLQGLGKDEPDKMKSQGVPQVPGYIKLSAEAASWAGPHGDRWEDPMPEEDEVRVDWIRVWQK